MSRRWVGCDIEEHYFGDDRKETKHERKMAIANDRSQYKKSDQDQLKKQPVKPSKASSEGLFKGRVLSIVPEGIIVDHEGQRISCSLRGALKKIKGQYKNLVTVGDFVFYQKADGDGTIVQIEPRRTILSRADNLSRRKEQLIAANIDQVLITSSVVEPSLKPFLVDRYIIAARKGGMNPIIVINKIDLLKDENNPQASIENEIFEEMKTGYASAGIPFIAVSTLTGEGIEDLKAAMKEKASVFAGQSGVGKSSLINAAVGVELKVGDVVKRTKKGTHTTTTAQLLPLEGGGWCIDTPGIKSFGVWDLKKDEVVQYFSEIFAYGRECHFQDCTHTHETGCAVHLAVENEQISLLRYESYLALIGTLSQEHLRR